MVSKWVIAPINPIYKYVIVITHLLTIYYSFLGHPSKFLFCCFLCNVTREWIVMVGPGEPFVGNPAKLAKCGMVWSTYSLFRYVMSFLIFPICFAL